MDSAPSSFNTSQTTDDQQTLADIVMDDPNFDGMPALQEVSDSSDSELESDDDDDDESDRDAHEVEMQAVDDNSNDRPPPLIGIDSSVPPSVFPFSPNLASGISTSTLLRSTSNRRARVEDDEDEERDRRHPSQRVSSASSTPSLASRSQMSSSSPTLNLPQASASTPTLPPAAQQPRQQPSIQQSFLHSIFSRNGPANANGMDNNNAPFRLFQHLMPTHNIPPNNTNTPPIVNNAPAQAPQPPLQPPHAAPPPPNPNPGNGAAGPGLTQPRVFNIGNGLTVEIGPVFTMSLGQDPPAQGAPGVNAQRPPQGFPPNGIPGLNFADFVANLPQGNPVPIPPQAAGTATQPQPGNAAPPPGAAGAPPPPNPNNPFANVTFGTFPGAGGGAGAAPQGINLTFGEFTNLFGGLGAGTQGGGLPGFPAGLAGLFGLPREEKEDPERARKLVDGLDEVPAGLVKRMERVGGGGNGDGTGGGDGVCAICWDRLLIEEEEQKEQDDDEKEMNVVEKNADEDSTSSSSVSDDESHDHDHDQPKEHKSKVEPKVPKIVALPCAHVFHAECLIPWFSRPRHTTCPTCRFNIDPENLTYVSANARARAARERQAAEGGQQQQETPGPADAADAVDAANAAAAAQQGPPAPATQGAVPPTPAPGGPVEDIPQLDGFAAFLQMMGGQIPLPGVQQPGQPQGQATGQGQQAPGPQPPQAQPQPQPIPVGADPTGFMQAFTRMIGANANGLGFNGEMPPLIPVELPPGARGFTNQGEDPFFAVFGPGPGQGGGVGQVPAGAAMQGEDPFFAALGPGLGQGGAGQVPTGAAGQAQGPQPARAQGGPAPGWTPWRVVVDPPTPLRRPGAQAGGNATPAADNNNTTQNTDAATDNANAANPAQANDAPSAQAPQQPQPGMHGDILRVTVDMIFDAQPFDDFAFVPQMPAAPGAPAAAGGAPGAESRAEPADVLEQADQLGRMLNTDEILQLIEAEEAEERREMEEMDRFGELLQQAMEGSVNRNNTTNATPPAGAVPQTQAQPQPQAGPQGPVQPPLNRPPGAFMPIGGIQVATGTGRSVAQAVSELFAGLSQQMRPPQPQQQPGQANRGQVPQAQGPTDAGPSQQVPQPQQQPQPQPRQAQQGQPQPQPQQRPAPPRGPMPNFLFNPFEALFGASRQPPQPERPKRPWAPPPAPGPTLRQRVERREREAGLRCDDVSCGIGPSDEDPVGEVINGMKRLEIRRKGHEEQLCEHRFHSACLVSAERVALRDADAVVDEEDGSVEVSCPICRGVGCISKEEWAEGVKALA